MRIISVIPIASLQLMLQFLYLIRQTHILLPQFGIFYGQ